jgi:hypothetical protein
MGRRQRIDVVEREDMLFLEYGLVRDLEAQDEREDVSVVIGLGVVDRHETNSA